VLGCEMHAGEGVSLALVTAAYGGRMIRYEPKTVAAYSSTK